DRFHEVEVLGWSFFDTVSLVSYASVLHRVGTRVRALEVRSAAFRAALNDDDHAVALSAALAGLPEAEDTAGDSVRAAQLRQVDHQALSEADRTLLFTNLARQTALLGHPVEAVEAARSALDTATSDGERSAAATALWLSAGPLVHPRERLQRFLDALGDQRAPQAWTPRLHQLEALSNFELGRLREAARSNELSATAAARQLDVLRHWHSELLRSSMFHARGLREAASVSAQAANALATDWAIAEGVAALGVHLFVDAWVRGDLATMELVIDSAGEGMGHSLLVRSGGVVAAARRGQDVSQRAVEMVEDQLAAPGTHMLAVLALMCDAASGSLPRDLASDILDTFDRHRQTLIVIGAGAACLGPVEWYRHKLTGDMADLEEALVCCDRAGALLWSALVLRELVDQHGRDDLAERCHSLGVLTGLEPED
ncbi:MAG: hypothetical protein GY946_29460, partial [bacterium]|nr:hypothetical protein [bacterium]